MDHYVCTVDYVYQPYWGMDERAEFDNYLDAVRWCDSKRGEARKRFPRSTNPETCTIQEWLDMGCDFVPFAFYRLQDYNAPFCHQSWTFAVPEKDLERFCGEKLLKRKITSVETCKAREIFLEKCPEYTR